MNEKNLEIEYISNIFKLIRKDVVNCLYHNIENRKLIDRFKPTNFIESAYFGVMKKLSDEKYKQFILNLYELHNS